MSIPSNKTLDCHRYTMTHALAASAVLGVLVFSQGLGKFWQQFVHGFDNVMSAQTVLQNLLTSTLFFGTLVLVMWASTLFFRKESAGEVRQRPNRFAAIKLALVYSLPMTIVALAVNWVCATAIECFTGVKPADQELVKCFTDGGYSFAMRALIMIAVVFQAPLLEEPLFRGVIFRGFAKSLPVWASMLLSGFVFALVHVNAASFVALVFLGVAFAHLYHRTGSILAPMTAHLLFNTINLILLFMS